MPKFEVEVEATFQEVEIVTVEARDIDAAFEKALIESFRGRITERSEVIRIDEIDEITPPQAPTEEELQDILEQNRQA